MRVAIATVQVPFIQGGAEILLAGLVKALKQQGHETEVITMPFRFAPAREVERSMAMWTEEDLACINGYPVQRVICLKFPAFYLQHPQKVTWLIHQHRVVYDLWDVPLVGKPDPTPEDEALRQQIWQQDTRALQDCHRVFTIAQTVSDRLQAYNQIPSQALYNPPVNAEHFYHAPAEPYIYFPSRLEELKRQHLLIKAMAQVKSPVVALLSGEGGQKAVLQGLIDQLGLHQKVRLLGHLSRSEMIAYYAHCLAVFFGPYNEDYGYVTLEAMLAGKPVITCTDSGGPLEFVVSEQTGLVVEPTPEAVATAIDQLYSDRIQAAEMGFAGRERYHSLQITWENVLGNLLS